MKYQININQVALAETNLDMVDAAILDYLIYYCNSPSPRIEDHRIIADGKKYTWINYEALLEDLPLLRIKSPHSLTPRVHKIEKEGFIEMKIGRHSRLYVVLTEKTDSIFIRPANSKNRETSSEESSKRFLPATSKNRQNDSTIYTNNQYTKTRLLEKNGNKESQVEKLPDSLTDPDHINSLASDILTQFKDQHSTGYYQLVAKKIPEPVIRQAMSELKVDGARIAPRLFTFKMNEYAKKYLKSYLKSSD